MNYDCLLIDACQYSPNYNNCMLDGMVKHGARILYATTPFPHAESPIPKNVKVSYCFFFLARVIARISDSHGVRRIARALEYPFNMFGLLVAALFLRIKVVHYMWTIMPVLDYWFIRCFRLLGIKVVYTAHNSFPHEFKAIHIKRFSRIYKTVDEIIVLTDYTRREIIEKSGVEDSKIAVVAHGDFNYIMDQCDFNEELHRKVSAIVKDKKVATFMGLIRPYKGLEYFIKAFKKVVAQCPDAYFIIAGSTRFADESRIRELIAEHGESMCYADFRYLPMADFKVYLKLSDLLVQPYISASQSGNTAMAYAAGVPVISTDVGGLAEMVEDGKTGWIVKPKDAEAISKAIVQAFAGDKYLSMKKYCQTVAAGEYGWEMLSRKILDVYGN